MIGQGSPHDRCEELFETDETGSVRTNVATVHSDDFQATSSTKQEDAEIKSAISQFLDLTEPAYLAGNDCNTRRDGLSSKGVSLPSTSSIETELKSATRADSEGFKVGTATKVI
jgi:hypothetical protein